LEAELMSLLTQFYNCGGGGGVSFEKGSFPGLWGIEPYDPLDPPTALVQNYIQTYNFSQNYSNVQGEFDYITEYENNYRVLVNIGGGGILVGSGTSYSFTGLWEEMYYYVIGTQSSGNSTTTINSPNATKFFGLTFNLKSGNGNTLTLNMNNMPNLVTIGGAIDFRLVNGGLSGTINLDFTGNALDQTSVDNVLVAVSNATVVGAPPTKTLDLSGGTSSTPGAAGLAAITTLTGAGWTVTTN
jgi:hypothetical protein